MQPQISIIIDLLGSDNSPKTEAEAIKLFLKSTEPELLNVKLIAVGNESSLNLLPEDERIEKVYASKGVPMNVQPAFALRNLKDSTMAIGIDLLSQGRGDVFLSAGNTGAVLAFSLKYLKRLEGIDRPGIMIVLPKPLGHKIIIDCGANSDCKPDFFVGFAKLGMAAAKSLFGKENPSVGLLNLGEEKEKGDKLRKEAYEKLETLGESFYGNLEPHDLFHSSVDVVVTDGFTGNILLKTLEGSFDFLMRYLKRTLSSGNILQSLAVLVLKPVLKNAFKEFEYQTYGAALLAGLSHPVLIAHGRSDKNAILNALKYAVKASEIQSEIKAQFGNKEEIKVQPQRKKGTLFD
ncbi:MAG: phosphate acyltransferase PlsX [Actinobacteria bacterium]|nr:phosphate acyltransferase PlsX [Actinomycetota bacterium]